MIVRSGYVYLIGFGMVLSYMAFAHAWLTGGKGRKYDRRNMKKQLASLKLQNGRSRRLRNFVARVKAKMGWKGDGVRDRGRSA